MMMMMRRICNLHRAKSSLYMLDRKSFPSPDNVPNYSSVHARVCVTYSCTPVYISSSGYTRVFIYPVAVIHVCIYIL